MNDPNRDDQLEGREEPEMMPAISESDNDQESHVSPSDNDGETIPQDEVVDQTGG